MDEHDRRRNLGVIAGAVLILAGLWFILERVAGPLIGPLRAALDFVWSIGWPLALVGLGVLLIVRRDALHSPGSLEGRRLYRSRTDRMVGGVLGGLAVYLNREATLLRIIFALLVIVAGFGPGIIAYIVAMVVVPEEPVAGATADDGSARSAPPAPPIPPPTTKTAE